MREKDSLNFNWDHCNDPELILVRRMIYDDPRSVLKDHPREELKKLFLKKIHLFQRQERSFWKLILEVSDEELAQASERNFRDSFKIWPY